MVGLCISLFAPCRAVFGLSRAVFSAYRVVFGVCRAVFGVCRAGFNLYKAVCLVQNMAVLYVGQRQLQGIFLEKPENNKKLKIQLLTRKTN